MSILSADAFMLLRSAFVFSCDCPYSPEELEEVLASRKFNGIGQLDVDHLGWINPKEIESAPLVHVVDSIYLVALQKESKIVPASTVKKKLAAAMAEAEKREGRPATRKERKALKDQVYESLLPGAPTRIKHTFGVLVPSRKQLLVLTSSAKCVEDFHGAFTDSFMKRGMRPSFRKLRTVEPPSRKMTEWLLNNECEGGFMLGEHCELTHEKSKVRYTAHELDRPEIREHLLEGKSPVKLGLRHESTTTFIITCSSADDDLGFSKIHYGDNDGKSEGDASADEIFDADLVFSVTEFLGIANELFEVFGGIAADADSLASEVESL